jgi:hypothetical protein
MLSVSVDEQGCEQNHIKYIYLCLIGFLSLIMVKSRRLILYYAFIENTSIKD